MAQDPTRPVSRVQLDGRSGWDSSRTSPRMRFDVLQVAAWLIGLALVVGSLVAVARAGFDRLGLFEPVVRVGGMAATPLMALLALLLGVGLLVAATGSVAERGLRLTGVLLGVIGAVWWIEPSAFAPYLATEADTGVVALAVGALLAAASFVPPLSVPRPGTDTGGAP